MHTLTGEKVAVKILEKDKIQDVADVERVAREIHILKIVRHPNVIQLYEIIETEKQLYLIMEQCGGGELFDYIVAHHKVKEKKACLFFQQIISGIDYISKLGIVHRDLKPENLLLDFDDNIKLIDFGLSNTYKKAETLKTACGSPCYAAPEMIEGKRYIGTRVDIWSAGVILFAMICGFLPFEDPNTSNLYKKILSADYHIPSFVSESAKDLLNSILNTDPEKRFTIEQIREHPWYKQHSENTYNGIVVGQDQIPVDQGTIKQMEKYDIDLDYSKKCIEANKHNHVTATYHLLIKKQIKRGEVTIQAAYESENDLSSLMRRQPRFKNFNDLNDNMPQHLRMETGNSESIDDLTGKAKSKTHRKDVQSLPPKSQKPKVTNLNTIASPDEMRQHSRRASPIEMSEAKRRTGSTGGSSIKDTEIIRSDVKKFSGSPSPSPPSHPQFPLKVHSSKKERPIELQTLKQTTPSNMLNNTTIANFDHSQLIELPNVPGPKYRNNRKRGKNSTIAS